MSETTQDDYNNITYEDLSTEFEALFPFTSAYFSHVRSTDTCG